MELPGRRRGADRHLKAGRGYAGPYRASTSFRPRAGALRAHHDEPRRGTGVHWHLFGKPAKGLALPAGS